MSPAPAPMSKLDALVVVEKAFNDIMALFKAKAEGTITDEMVTERINALIGASNTPQVYALKESASFIHGVTLNVASLTTLANMINDAKSKQ